MAADFSIIPWSIQGKACSAYWQGDTNAQLYMDSRFGRFDVPVDIYFRSVEDMPQLETYALSLCRGKVLEVGAGVGSHALALQQMGVSVTAIDIDPLLVSIMKERGVRDARVADVFSFSEGGFDTILMMMNGIGLAGTLSKLSDLLATLQSLLNPGGRLLFDTSDLHLALESHVPGHHQQYYGEVWYTMGYQEEECEPFPWLFLDQDTMEQVFAEAGWQSQIAYEEGDGHYLVVAQPL